MQDLKISIYFAKYSDALSNHFLYLNILILQEKSLVEIIAQEKFLSGKKMDGPINEHKYN